MRTSAARAREVLCGGQAMTVVTRAASTRSSSVGSLSRQSATTDELSTGPVSAAYSPSKTFLNAVTVQYAKELQGTGILINLGCPGFVATDLNGFRGVRTPEQIGRAHV